MANVRILIADDHTVARRGVRALLETQKTWKVCGEAATGSEAIQLARKLKPDVVVMDITMPELNGLEATRQILAESPDIQVLILTMHESDEVVREVLSAGARSYVLKTDLDQELISGVHALLRGETFFSARASQVFLKGYLKSLSEPDRADSSSPHQLTPRQKEVVRHLAEGKINKEVAAALGISTKTVEAHRAQIMAKLRLHSFSDLVRYAVKEKIVEN
jgi:DNA-binding NarL/FixJ family response regulator